MIQAIDHVEITCEDLEKTLEFYTNVLGFKLTRWARYETTGYAGNIVCITLGDFMIELLGPTQRSPGQGDPADPDRVGVKMIALRVDDMAVTIDELRRQGVEVTWGPHPGGSFKGLRAEIKDPNGLSIELREWQGGDDPTKAEWEPTRPGVAKIV